MKLTVLGWQGPVPGAQGACSGYLLEAGCGAAIALDLGSGSLSRLVARRDPASLRAIVLSHLHWDHISDMLPLGYLAGANAVPVYAKSEPAFARAALESVGWKLHPHEEFSVGPFRVSFFAARHPAPASCIKVECEGRTFVYTGDTNTLPGLERFAQGADLLLADAGLIEADWAEEKPHLSPRLCAQLAARAGAKQLCVTHIAPKNEPASVLREAQGVFPNTCAAGGGMIIEF